MSIVITKNPPMRRTGELSLVSEVDASNLVSSIPFKSLTNVDHKPALAYEVTLNPNLIVSD
ncbi:MAG: hypothetical protein H0V98_00940 [Chloroflexia bacterium]|nr:hypothetical protein [Chloroflexia bacterium]